MEYVKAKTLWTHQGDYGIANVGQEVVLSKKHAEELEEKGILKIIGKSEGEEKQSEKKEGSFRITDNTGRVKEKAETETDPKNPTGEKNDKAGPGKINKK